MQEVWQGRTLYARMCQAKSKDHTTGNVLFANEDIGEEEHTESDSEYVFAVDEDHATTQIQIGGIKANVVIDSGACSNIMSKEEFYRLKRKGLKYKQHEVKKTLYAYGSSKPLDVLGGFETDVSSSDDKISA